MTTNERKEKTEEKNAIITTERLTDAFSIILVMILFVEIFDWILRVTFDYLFLKSSGGSNIKDFEWAYEFQVKENCTYLFVPLTCFLLWYFKSFRRYWMGIPISFVACQSIDVISGIVLVMFMLRICYVSAQILLTASLGFVLILAISKVEQEDNCMHPNAKRLAINITVVAVLYAKTIDVQEPMNMSSLLMED